MKEFYEYLEILLLISPLLFFIVAVSFRLLDNSAFLFLQKEILIESSYVSAKVLKEQLRNSRDFRFKRKIKRVLVFRRMHSICLSLTFITFPVTLLTYFMLY